jgi:hypothetical protein
MLYPRVSRLSCRQLLAPVEHLTQLGSAVFALQRETIQVIFPGLVETFYRPVFCSIQNRRISQRSQIVVMMHEPL